MDEETLMEFQKQVEEMGDKVMQMDEEMPKEIFLVAEGEFMPRAHEVAGEALLIEDGGNKKLRFEDF